MKKKNKLEEKGTNKNCLIIIFRQSEAHWVQNTYKCYNRISQLTGISNTLQDNNEKYFHMFYCGMSPYLDFRCSLQRRS